MERYSLKKIEITEKGTILAYFSKQGKGIVREYETLEEFMKDLVGMRISLREVFEHGFGFILESKRSK